MYLWCLGWSGCSTAEGDVGLLSAGETGDGTGGATTTASSTPTSSGSSNDGSSDAAADDAGTPKLDVEAQDTGDPPPPSCDVPDGELDGIQPCDETAPPDSFEPAVQWIWPELGGPELQVVATPLVANLTDDNADGTIDLCDTPDVVVVAYDSPSYDSVLGRIHVLDGASGLEHFEIPVDVVARETPALGDIDGDGLVDIVAAIMTDGIRRLAAFEHDGTMKWTSDAVDFDTDAVALADLDADGDVEIMVSNYVLDHDGHVLWGEPGFTFNLTNLTTAADLDDDGDLEVIRGATAFHHDGAPYYDQSAAISDSAIPQVADLDADGLPEILLAGTPNLYVLEHDGTIAIEGPQLGVEWTTAAAIHDIDGDGEPEILSGVPDQYWLFEADLGVAWTVGVSDESGMAAASAFDFLGDGTAEAVYADEQRIYVYDEAGEPLLTSGRNSYTGIEFPVVADIDNDASAEIVVISNRGYGNGAPGPAVQVLRDEQDRWIRARRIWNQHTYHVTNVREDGTIPQVEPKSWEALNTFRTQSQIGALGGVCRPAG